MADELWSRLEPLLPQRERRFRYPGRKPLPDRDVLCGLLYVLHTGIQWEHLPQDLGFGSGMTCWQRLRNWNQVGVWQRRRPRRKPDSLFADRGYDHDVYRGQVHDRGIVPTTARRGTRHGTGPGTYRWVVERTFAWLHGFRRLRIGWERRADIHEAFLNLACCLITYRQLGVLCRP